MAAVANRLENTVHRIIQNGKNHAAKVHAEILNRIRQHVRRRVHPVQNRRCQQNPNECQHETCDDCKRNRRMHRNRNILMIPCAPESADDNACANENTLKEADEHENQVAGRANCRHGLRAQHIAHDKRIRYIVELLKQVAQKDGNRKTNHQFPDAALCHVCRVRLICHLVYSLHCYFDRNQFHHSTFRQLVNVFAEKVAQHEKIANVKFRLQGCHERQIMV